MKYLCLLILIVFLSCKQQPSKPISQENESQINESIALEIYDYNELKPFLNKKDNKVHVVNFWATWCAPCVKELPYFEKINQIYSDKNVEVLLVSLDFPRQYETKLKPFLKAKQLKSKVICFDDLDQNMWIPAINANWTGALPATIIYKGNEQKFYEGSLTFKELESEVKQFLN